MISYFLNKAKTRRIDFTRPWWTPITDQKFYILFLLMGEIVVNSFKTYTPILISRAFENRNYQSLFIIFAAWLCIIFLEFLVREFNIILELKTMYSVQTSGNTFFLTVDPIYHAKRASGAILSKIVRATRGYEELLDRIVLDLLPVLISTITAIYTVIKFDYKVGLAVFAGLAFIIFLNIIGLFKLIIPIENDVLAKDDIARSVALENLTQIHLIRSTFASESIFKKYQASERAVMLQEGRQWISSEALYSIIKALYIATIAGLTFWLIQMVSLDKTSAIAALAVLMTYMRGTANIIKLGKPIRRAAKSIMRIKDLYKYIGSFGRQTYPVLSDDYKNKVCESPLNNTTNIVCANLFFDYNQQAKIFDGHNLNLKVPVEQENKLYGIIGPSGIGKSTLINILGGQLKPTHGSILINGIDIYVVDDAARKKIIALQGQVATNMRGSLRYNLLFGIEEHNFTDEYLTLILERVGLWNIFQQIGGLDTFVGESGMNLSGGQRQRLNFANLYLRAIFYRPQVVLIDEPTSSLDEVSEQAITQMIIEIAQNAVTLVIAHRLKTLESAVAILDFSTLQESTNLEFVPVKLLKKSSKYFQMLLQNKIELTD
jgi:ATP-binding cassette subfamily B protein AbcA/BmrA